VNVVKRSENDKGRGPDLPPGEAGEDAPRPVPSGGDTEERASRLATARLYRERGEVELAVVELEAARREAPDDVAVMVELGTALAAAGRPADGEKELRRAARIDPARVEAHFNLGVLLFKRGLYRPAAASLRRALDLDDNHGDAYFYLGETLNQLGEVDPALAMLERAVEFQPGNARAYFTMGILYDRKFLRQEATTMYRKARELGAA
jgi:tetratricopeptide (TPR) repeat protein